MGEGMGWMCLPGKGNRKAKETASRRRRGNFLAKRDYLDLTLSCLVCLSGRIPPSPRKGLCGHVRLGHDSYHRVDSPFIGTSRPRKDNAGSRSCTAGGLRGSGDQRQV